LKKVEVWKLQYYGFFVLSILYVIIGVVVPENAPASLAVFALTFFVTNLAPNMTTFIIPPLMHPASCRTTGHGIAAGAGKLGAAVGGYVLPILLTECGLSVVMYTCAGVAFAGFVICIVSLWIPAVDEWRKAHHHLLE